MVVNGEIRKEMHKTSSSNTEHLYNKLYVYHLENVSILFADIKVDIGIHI